MRLFKPNVDKLIARRDAAGLVSLLHDPEPSVRLRAAYALGQLGDVSAVEPLAALLDDAWADARFVSAVALATLGDHRAVGMLVEGASDPDASVRLTCAELLGNLNDAGGTDALITLLGDDDSDVRDTAAAALGRLRGRAVTAALLGVLADPSRGSLALAALAAQPRAARDRALRLLVTDPTLEHLRHGQAARALAVGSVDDLLSFLRDDDPATRLAAAELARALAGDTEGERAIRGIVDALEQHADVGALLALAECLEVPSWDKEHTPRWRPDCFGPELRRSAIEALGRLGDPLATDVVAQQLEPSCPHHETNEQRRCTRSALEVLPKVWNAQLLRAEGRHALTAALAATDRDDALATALAEIGDAGAVDLLLGAVERHPDLSGRVQPLLARVHDVDALTEGLGSSSERTAAMTATVLERLGVAATQPLIDYVRRHTGVPNNRAIEVLAKVGDRRAVEPLLEILATPGSGDWAAVAGLVARGRVQDVVDQLERSGAASMSLRLIEELPKALDADLLRRCGRAVLSRGNLERGYGLWDRVQHLLTRHVAGGQYLFDGADLHDIAETWLQRLESIKSRHWGELSEWDPLHTLLQKRVDAFDDHQLERVIDLPPIECEVWGGDEREMGGAFYTYDPEPLHQLAKAELRRRRSVGVA
jgi:HEAT repeat protein